MRWIIFVLCIFLSSCKTKKVAHDINFVSKENVQTEYVKFQSLVDTTNVLKTFKDNSQISIIETITITEYDKESGKPIKETNAKRSITQDTDQVATEEEQRAVSEVTNDSMNHFREDTQKVESETKEESIGGQESFGKWLGIIIGIGVFVLLVIFWKKIKTWLHL